MSSPDGDDTGLAELQAFCRRGLAAGIVMPETWPVLMFWAETGRETLREQTDAGPDT